MSHVAYDLQWSDAMNDLQEQKKVEEVPAEINEATGKPNIELPWTEDEIFQHLACLYIKYIDIYRKLEDCYDQMVQPQKRQDIKQVLESTMLRICEIKSQLVEHNPRTGSLYVHLDQLLFDLKYDPSIIEIPVPRYFKEKEDNIEVLVKLKEEVDRGGKKKKKKGGKKKKKKKAEAEPEPKMTLAKQIGIVKEAYKETLQMEEPDEMVEVVHDIFTIDMDLDVAIRLIQSNERGRQGIDRIQKIRKIIKKNEKEKQIRKQIQKGKNVEATAQMKEAKACEALQRRIRGILARKQIEAMREEEMVFLGMTRAPKTKEELANDPLEARKKTMQIAKMVQRGNHDKYEMERKELTKEITAVEGYDIKDKMLKERRDWVQEQKGLFGKIPNDLDKFNTRFNEDAATTPEEEAARKQAEEDAAADKKKKKEKKAKKKKGKKDKDEKGEDKTAKIGPNELVRKFDVFYEDYNTKWANRDETTNPDQKYDKPMAREEVMPDVQKALTKEVDEMIKQELLNMQALSGQKAKKKKKKGKKKAKKGKKKSKIKLPGGKYIHDISDYDILKELIQNQICKYLPAASLTDFLGEFNYIHSMLDNLETTPYDPSMALIRQLVVEYVIFPLGSELIRKRHPANTKSILFYGPEGTGKTLMVRACASETKSLVFDLSPVATLGQYAASKAETEKMVAMVMKVAKQYAPAIIYIDECEKVFPGKKKKQKGKKAKKNDMSNPARIKKALTKWRGKWITDDTRITIIGCTSLPLEGSKKDFKKFFDRSIYFPFPDYTTCRMLWKTFIEQCGGRVQADFPLHTLAHISLGYSAGSIRKTCEFVLTPYRKMKIDQRPLKLTEFIGPLSQCANTMDDQYDEFKTFTDITSGDKARRDAIAKALAGDDDGGDAKKGKKKKKKK